MAELDLGAVIGPHFTPSVDDNGVLSWTNDGGLENPAPVNIRGPNLEAGDNISLSQNGNTLRISANDTTYQNATTSTSGLMSSADKAKLDNMDENSFTDADRLVLDEAHEVSERSFNLVNSLLSGLQFSVYKYLISASGYIKVHSNRGVIDNIKVPTSYAGQTLFVARVAPVWITNDNAISQIYDPSPQIQSAVVASDGSISTKVDLPNNNYIIVVTTTNLAAALADREIAVSFTPILFSCRHTRRTNDFLDGIEFLAVNETEYLQALGYQLVYEEIADSPDNEFLNTDHAVFMFDGTNYYAVQTKPSTISQSATFYTAKYQRRSG